MKTKSSFAEAACKRGERVLFFCFEESPNQLMRIVDFLKANQITALFTSLTSNESALEGSDVGISSLIDTWLLLRDYFKKICEN